LSSFFSNQRPSPPPTAIHIHDNSGEEQKQPSSFLLLPIREETSNVRSGKTTPLSGRDTPTISDAAKAEDKPVPKVERKVQWHIWWRGMQLFFRSCYPSQKHLILARAQRSGETFTSRCARSITFPQATILSHHLPYMGTLLRCMVHLRKPSGLCPYSASYTSATDDEIKEHSESLFILVISCKRKYLPKTWWSVGVLSLLLALHLLCTAQNSAEEQSLDWLEGKSVEAKNLNVIKRIASWKLK